MTSGFKYFSSVMYGEIPYICLLVLNLNTRSGEKELYIYIYNFDLVVRSFVILTLEYVPVVLKIEVSL